MKRAVILALAVGALAACGEKPQTLGANRSDAPAYSGTGKAYADPAWKAGDKKSWESQLRARSQYGQNDFSRMP